MSMWYEAKREDISYDEKQDELNIYVTNDDMGSIYVTVKRSLIAEVLKQTNPLPYDQTYRTTY